MSRNAQVSPVERVGGVLGKELPDGASAWKRGSRRPGWDKLLERLRSGASQGVVVWNIDRLLRSPWDLETLIDLGNKGYRVLSRLRMVTASGRHLPETYQPPTCAGRRPLRRSTRWHGPELRSRRPSWSTPAHPR